MATAQRAIRRCLTLLASSSAGAIALMTAAGGAAMLAPDKALATNECGAQSGSTPIVCLAGTYKAGISYSATAGSDINLVLQDGVISRAGLSVFNPSGGNISVTASANASAADVIITNDSGYGVQLESAGDGGVTLDLTDAGAADPPGQIIGLFRGVSARSDRGPIFLNLADVPVTAHDVDGAGIMAVTDGDLTIKTAAPITATSFGIRAWSFGDINVATTAAATIRASTGVVLAANGNITLMADGNIGTPSSRVASGVLVSSLGIPAAFGEDTSVIINGDIYTSGGGISASNAALAGNLEVAFGQSRAATLDGGYSGIFAADEYFNSGDVSVDIGDGSAISSVIDVTATNSGLGKTSVNLGSGVRISGASGVMASSSRSRAAIVAGPDLNIALGYTGIWDSGYGLSASSSAAADRGGPSAKITIGENATLTNTDPLTYDVGFVQAAAPNGTASASINLGDGLALSQAGEYVAGVFGRTNLGDVNINVGTGSIDLTGGAPRSVGVRVPGSSGILALSQSGDISVTSAVDINAIVNGGGTQTVSGIWAITSGSGLVAISNSGVIQAASGIIARSGSGGATVSNTGAISGSYGIAVLADGGSAEIVNSGAIDTDAGGLAGTATGAGQLDIQNSATVHGDGYGIVGSSERGGVSISNSGDVSGYTGIFGVSSEGAVEITSSGDVVTQGHGIEGAALGDGAVTIITSGFVTAGQAGIYGLTNTGDLDITSDGAVTGLTGIYASVLQGGHASITASGPVTGQVAGIDVEATNQGSARVLTDGPVVGGDFGIRALAQLGVVIDASGPVAGETAILGSSAGDLTITAQNVAGTAIGISADGYNSTNVTAGNVSGRVNAIVATGTLGDVAITGNGDIRAETGSAIEVNAGGVATVSVGPNGVVSGARPTIDVTAAGDLTVDNSGTIKSSAGSASDVVIRAQGPSALLSNHGLLLGAVDFSPSDALTFNNAGTWRLAGMSLFTGGDDTLNNTGVIADDSVLIDFGGGADTFVNAGTLIVGQGPANTLTLANLETFNNSGLILFGSVDGVHSDGQANDRLVAQGTAFTGSGASTLAMDVNLGGATQANCSAATVADCFDLTGGSTAGSTLIRVSDTRQSAGALNSGIVLVDVHGGTSHAGDFTLDPTSSGYTVDPTLGAGLEKGAFLYQLTYDSANQRHELVSLPSSHAFELAPLAASAQSIWYTSTGTWFHREADLHETVAAGGSGPGVWIKMTGAQTDRDATSAYGPYRFNISNKQDTVGLLGGIDLLHGEGDGQAYVVGLNAGNLNSDVEFKASHRTARLEGQAYGAYASWISNSFFLDGIVEQNDLDLTDNSVVRAKGKVKSTGGQVEGGWRMPMGSLSVEPLASLAYVRTKFDDLALPGASLHTEDAKSLRGSLGVRVSGDADLHSATLVWDATGRVWDEFEGKNRAVLISNGQSIGMPDDVSGAFGDVGVGISLYSPSGHVSTFLNTGLVFKDNYHSSDTAIGFSVRW